MERLSEWANIVAVFAARNLGLLADIASLLGLFIAIPSFWWTIVSVRRVKIETRRARREVTRILERLSTQLFLDGLQVVEEQLRKMRESCRMPHRERAIDSYEEASSALTRLHDEPRLSAEDTERIRGFLEDLRQIKAGAQAQRRRARPDPETAARIDRLDEMVHYILRLRGRYSRMEYRIPD